MQDPIVVDDNEPSITYAGAWVLQNWSPEYAGTMHGTDKAGSTATIEFFGISIAVYGTVGIETTYGIPITTYTLDSNPPVSYTAPAVTNNPLPNQLFYSSGELENADHTLVIEFTNEDKATFWLDYMQIIPQVAAASPSATSSPETQGGVPLRTPISTAQPASSTAGNNAALSVSGSVTQDAIPTSQGASVPSEASAPAGAGTGSSTTSHTSTPLTNSQALAMPTGGGQTMQSASSAPTIVVGSGQANAATGSPTTSTTPPSPSSHRHSNSVLITAVSVVIVLVLIGLVIFAVWYLRRRRHRQLHHLVAGLQEPSGPNDTPYNEKNTSGAVYGTPTTPSSATALVAEPQPRSNVASCNSVTDTRYRQSGCSYDSSGSMIALPAMSSPLDSATSRPVAVQDVEEEMGVVPRRHRKPRRQMDSGVRLAGGPLRGPAVELDDDLPPAYSDLA